MMSPVASRINRKDGFAVCVRVRVDQRSHLESRGDARHPKSLQAAVEIGPTDSRESARPDMPDTAFVLGIT